MSRPRLPIDEHAVLTAYRNGWSLPAIAQQLHVDRSRVTRVVKEAGIFGDRRGTVTRLPNHTDAPEGTIGAVALADKAGITYRQLDVWTRSGHVNAIPRPRGASTGTPRHYTTTEAAALVLMARLVADGLQPRQAAHHARRLLEWGTTSIAGMSLHLSEEL